MSVDINVPPPMFASEQGTYSAPGFPNLGLTQDSSFQGVGTFGFFVFGAYALPPNTPVTLSVTTFYGPNYTGGVAYVSTMTWDCTTGAILSLENGIPTPPAEPVGFCPNSLPDGSVVGEAPLGAQIYWAPDEGSASQGLTLNPGTYWVVGVDETGNFSKIWLTCTSQFWVLSSALQPNYAPPWNGQPLPTRVVS